MKDKKNNGVYFAINATPIAVYEEFLIRAEKSYGNCFWMTIKGDMDKAKLFEAMTDRDEAVFAELERMDAEIQELKAQLENKNALEEAKEQSETEPKQGLGSMIDEE